MTENGRIVTFYSFKGGVGRTMSVANVAWILASAGKNVLVADWDLESPGLNRYLHPLMFDPELAEYDGVIDMVRGYALQPPPGMKPDAWRRQCTDLTERVQRLEMPEQDWGTIDFLGPGRQHDGYEPAVATMRWTEFFDNYEGRAFFADLRAAMLAGDYDYILIDSRTGLSDNASVCTKLLPDTVVVGFTMSTQAINGGAGVAFDIDAERDGREIRVLPVPMRVEGNELEKLVESRKYARAAFGELPRGLDKAARTEYWDAVEIPYRPYYAFEEVLAAIAEAPGQANAPLTAYERLTGYITGGAVQRYRPISEAKRLDLLAKYERKAPVRTSSVVIAAAPRARMWAQWVRDEASRVNVLVKDLPTDPDIGELLADSDVVVVPLTQDLLDPPWESALSKVIGHRFDRVTGRVPGVVAIPVEHFDLPENIAVLDKLHLEGASADEARRRLFDRLGLSWEGIRRPSLADTGTRFPCLVPGATNISDASPRFVGRSDYLDRMRTHLGWEPSSPLLLYGPRGFGKSAIAREFVHRFGADYDIIWRIPAYSRDEVRARLLQLRAELGRMNLATPLQTGDGVDGLLGGLHRGDVRGRWLLIYDEAISPSVVAELLPAPSRRGHILITSSGDGTGWPDDVVSLPVEEMNQTEALGLLSTWAAVDPTTVSELIDRLGTVPEVLERAARWIAGSGVPAADAAREFMASFEQQLDSVAQAADASAVAPAGVIAAWSLALEQASPAARLLLELCAYLSPDGVSMDVLQSAPMIDYLATQSDVVRLRRSVSPVLGELNRNRLSRVADDTDRQISLPRLVYMMMRKRTEAGGLAAERQTKITEVLASYVPAWSPSPTDRDDERYAELQRHLPHCGVIDSDTRDARRWLVQQSSYLLRTGRPHEVLSLAQPLITKWPERDDLRLWLGHYVGNALRALSRTQEAAALGKQIYDLQVEVLGREHLDTLRTATTRASDMRQAGRLQQALEIDQKAYESFRTLLGDDDIMTLAAARNLAHSQFLAGDPQAAYHRARETWWQLRHVTGMKNPQTWSAALSLASRYNQLGLTDEAVPLLQGAVQYFSKTGDSLQLNFADRLLGIANRLQGELTFARSQHTQALARYVEDDRAGPDHPATMACEMSLAIDRHLLGQTSTGQTAGEVLLARYRSSFAGMNGETHPFVYLCQANVSVFVRGRDPAEALRLSTAAYRGLSTNDQVGPSHHFTLAVAVCHANNLIADGQTAAAFAVDQASYSAFDRFYGQTYPDTLIAARNLADSQLRDARVEAPDDTHPAREDILTEIPLP
ncbi:tetratricopeptide repeat protein [Frankia sp. AgB1.9]|uniref:FxSxx-COOH system tetratricopeptide repeat protein n=1 Tax=unclassified Frankia TaxID=2632575 RepID=UPI001931D24E|nr:MULTISPECIES: FxSxx-COOH system tetratricopeptide repeat protein [unclassified Frankia]MBL7494397.1 tetratricopeptide repeat protein [Frankia sp. AgW1.1]MBL7553533.1 tetratricopeptide repeat protein [Frankia sp. AgB1.9]MBL7622466.1 tetratricopeptide repeat protein [Frankia sp. AgB1.8]